MLDNKLNWNYIYNLFIQFFCKKHKKQIWALSSKFVEPKALNDHTTHNTIWHLHYNTMKTNKQLDYNTNKQLH